MEESVDVPGSPRFLRNDAVPKVGTTDIALPPGEGRSFLSISNGVELDVDVVIVP